MILKAVRNLVLASRPEENPYGDTAQTYSYPKLYRHHFEALSQGEEINAVLYETGTGNGRGSYIAWTVLREPPHVDPSNSAWQLVRHANAQPFPVIVPRRIGDEWFFEQLLRDTPLQSHGAALQGKSVRTLETPDFLRILEYAGLVATEGPVDAGQVGDAERRRQERVVQVLVRDARFRAAVVAAYDFRCAVSGLGYADHSSFALGQLVEAAHIKPVAHGGDDQPQNGIALTPSLHGLFAAGLFTLRYEDNALWVQPSPFLSHVRLSAGPRGASLPLTADTRAVLPANSKLWPSRENLDYHAKKIFRE